MGMSDMQQNNLPDVEAVKPLESTTPLWFRRAILAAGLVLGIVGIPVAINLFCIVPLVLINSSGSNAIIYGVASLTFALLTIGAGGAAFLHANRSLKNKPSKSLRFPIPELFVAVFIFLLGLGSVIAVFDGAVGLFFPPILIACAVLPPLWAVAWMIPQAREDSAVKSVQETTSQPPLSWRRGLLSFTGGATVSVVIAIALEILMPIIILSLVFNLADTVSGDVRVLLRALSSAQVAEALTNPGFIFIFVQMAVIAPLPRLRRRSPNHW
jgi:hypothetical protein